MILSSTSVERCRTQSRLRFAAVLLGLGIAGASGESPALADVSPSARALARSLFEDARSLMAEKKFGEACPKLAESLRLDRAAGTQLNLAFCHEGEGRTATAWAEYNDALTQARRDGRPEREEFVAGRLRALEGKLALLTITLAPGADVPGLEVSLDGAVVGPAALGVASPVDPGTHSLAARAPGFSPWSLDVHFATGDGKRTVVVPPLVDTRGLPTTPEGQAGRGSVSGQDAAGMVRSNGERRTWGLVLLGTGLASTSVGAAFGVDAVVKWRDRNAWCAHGCNETGVQAGSAAQTSAWVSDFTIGAGVAALAVGAYLLLTPTSSTSPAAHRAETGRRARLRAFPIVTGSEVGLGLWGVME